MNIKTITFATLTAFISSSNDVITKFISADLPTEQASFLRFLFSLITLLPFMRKEHIHSLKNQLGLQILRGGVGSLALGLFMYSLREMPLPTVTVLSLTQTLFLLPVSSFFLKEALHPKVVVAACLGFLGVVIFFLAPLNFSSSVLLLLLSSFLFALLDIIAKKLVSKACFFTMLWHFALITTLLAAPAAIHSWQTPSLSDVIVTCILGAGANLLQITLFLALKSAPAHYVSPFRYLEVVFACAFGWFFFQETLTPHMLIGSLIIVLSTYYITQKAP